MFMWQFFFIGLLFVLAVNGRRPRKLGEPCGEDELMKCADGLECALKGTGGKRRCREAMTTAKEPKGTSLAPESGAILERCLRAKCPVLFPDCPSDSVPVLSTGPISNDGAAPDGCCQPAIVQCRCDSQKCLVPACPEETQRLMSRKGTEIPGQCCDHFECRTSTEPNCQNVNCPDPTTAFLDLYSPDGQNCPDDSFRPAPYIPSGSCCPIVPQCQCRHGICEPARCNSDQKFVIERRGRGEPGKCCDQFKCIPKNGSSQMNGEGGCHHEGRIFAEGERWRASACQECQCSAAGVALCRRMECPTLTSGCQRIGLSPGDCCPVCLGCRDEEGQTYAIGEHWERDGCTNCTCGMDFRWQCQKFICQTNCENPKTVPGECCPICDEPTIMHEPAPSCPELANCPLRCQFGLKQDRQTGCFECKCAIGTELNEDGEQCDPKELTKENCPRMCAHGYLHDEQNGCPICRCAHCPPMGNCEKTCLHGYETNWMGCPICKCKGDSFATTAFSIGNMENQTKCKSNPTEREMGEWWTENCRQCFCQEGKEFCSLLACPARPTDCPEQFWLRHKEECCPRCAHSSGLPSFNSILDQTNSIPNGAGQQVCHSPGTGQLFVDGQTWHLAEDGCLSCTCRMGHVLCVWNDGRQCPPTLCQNPVIDPNIDKCCPRCPFDQSGNSLQTEQPIQCEDNSTGIFHNALSEWRRDECQSCRCREEGMVECHREHCYFPLKCSGRLLSLKGRCCPICSDSLANSTTCIYEGHVYASGEQFQDGPCRNCTCLPGGLLKCLEIHCPNCHSNSDSFEQIGVQDQCCAKCQRKIEDFFSSFEQGSEQTIFPGLIEEQQSKNGWEERPSDNLSFWIFIGLGLPILAFILFAVGIAVLVVKCRREKAKCMNSNNHEKKPLHWHLTLTTWRNAQMRSFPKESENDLAASVSLLRLKEQSNL